MVRRGFTPALALAAALVLWPAPGAHAAYDPLASGQTKLTLDQGFLALLKQNGVKLSARAPARLKAGTVSFPVTGGKLDPTTSNGVLEHEGALLLTASGRSVPVKALQLKTTQKRSPFSARAGGSQLKLASAKELEVTRAGFGNKVEVTGLTLSAKLATRLAKKLRLRGVLKEGQPLGSTLTKAQPRTVRLLGKGKVTLSLDPGFQAKIASLFVAVNPIFPAERPTSFTLPISGGEIAPSAIEGRVETAGSLEFLQQGGGQAFWADASLDLQARAFSPEVELRPSPPYAGKLGPVPVAGFALASASANAKQRTVSVTGSLVLEPGTAQAFNELFARPQGRDGVFVAGEAVGGLAFVAQGQ
jgi:hypothetical protein